MQTGSTGSPGTCDFSGLEGLGALLGRHLLPIPSLLRTENPTCVLLCLLCARCCHKTNPKCGCWGNFPSYGNQSHPPGSLAAPRGDFGQPTKSIVIQQVGNPQLIPRACSGWFVPAPGGGGGWLMVESLGQSLQRTGSFSGSLDLAVPPSQLQEWLWADFGPSMPPLSPSLSPAHCAQGWTLLLALLVPSKL